MRKKDKFVIKLSIIVFLSNNFVIFKRYFCYMVLTYRVKHNIIINAIHLAAFFEFCNVFITLLGYCVTLAAKRRY